MRHRHAPLRAEVPPQRREVGDGVEPLLDVVEVLVRAPVAGGAADVRAATVRPRATRYCTTALSAGRSCDSGPPCTQHSVGASRGP